MSTGTLDSAGRSQRRRRVEIPRHAPGASLAAGIAAITLVGAALRFHGLGDQSLWADEAITRDIVAGSLGSAWREMTDEESAPPLYYLVEWAWVRLFGTSDVALRWFSAVVGTLTIPAIAAAARRLGGRATALIAAGLAACSPFLVWYSQEARAYSLYVFLCAISFWLFARLRDQPTTGSLAVWSLASAAAVATHYFAALLVIGEVGWLLAGTRSGRRRIAVAAVPIAALIAGLVPYALARRDLQAWIPSFPLEDRISALPSTSLVGIADLPSAVSVAAIALACSSFILLLWRGNHTEKRGVLIAASMVFAAVLIVAVAAWQGVDQLTARNLLAVWPPLATVIAIGFGAQRAGRLGSTFALALCAIGLGVTIEMKSNENQQRVAWETAARLIGPPGDRVIGVPSPFGHRPLLDYLRERGGDARDVSGLPRTTELVLLKYQTPDHDRGDNCYSGTPCGMPGPAQTPFSVPPGFQLVERRTEDLFTLARYRSAVKRPIRIRMTPLSQLVSQTGGDGG